MTMAKNSHPLSSQPSSDAQDLHPGLRRSGSWPGRFLFYISPLMALASALWISLGRSLWGAGGELQLIFLISFGPALALILLLSFSYSLKELRLQEKGVRAGLPQVMSLVLLASWFMAGLFGLWVPDRIEGRNVSAFAALLGPEVMGLSAAFANTTGILTFALAIASLLLALGHYRRARDLRRGIDSQVREELERQESIYDFID